MKRRTVLQLGTGFIGATALPRMAWAQSTAWDLADEYVATLMPGRAANFFISRVHERLGDQLQITYQGGGALGYRSADHFDAVESGSVQAATTLVTQLNGIDPLFNVSNLPFLVKSIGLYYAAGALLTKEFAESGAKSRGGSQRQCSQVLSVKRGRMTAAQTVATKSGAERRSPPAGSRRNVYLGTAR